MQPILYLYDHSCTCSIALPPSSPYSPSPSRLSSLPPSLPPFLPSPDVRSVLKTYPGKFEGMLNANSTPHAPSPSLPPSPPPSLSQMFARFSRHTRVNSRACSTPTPPSPRRQPQQTSSACMEKGSSRFVLILIYGRMERRWVGREGGREGGREEGEDNNRRSENKNASLPPPSLPPSPPPTDGQRRRQDSVRRSWPP